MRRVITIGPLLFLACSILLLSAPALAAPQQEHRIALVIGNAAYPTAPLKNPVNDARDMAASLRSMGFEVILRENATLAQMEGAVNEFWQRLRRGGAGLFYFAGHGLQVSGRNYLVPVDARLEAEQDAKYKCMDAGLVLGRMENAGNDLNIIILDACRNNPFARSWRSADQGLAKMDAPKGSIIAYATAPDSVAADGEGKNGLYTEKLLKAMRAPGQPVEQMFKRVRDEVMRATKDKQVPWESTSLRGDFYFSPGNAAPGAPALSGPAAAPSPPPVEVALGSAPKQAPPLADEHKIGDTWTEPTTGMEFVWVPGGCYKMGSADWNWWRTARMNNQLPVHEVCLTGYWLGKTEVTQSQWQKVMRRNASTQGDDDFPVAAVTWEGARSFATRMSALGQGKFRLPTEAEWEYACRSGGKDELYSGGNDLTSVGWVEENSGGNVHYVATLAPNGLGLYDMTGNVWEWVEDVYSDSAYASHVRQDPVHKGPGTERVMRGGNYLDLHGEFWARCTYRYWAGPGVLYTGTGLRLVREP